MKMVLSPLEFRLRNVPRLGGKAFEQAAGFLRIKNGENPLDDSACSPRKLCFSS